MAARGSKPKEITTVLCPPDPKFILKSEMGHVHCINFSLKDNKNFVTLYAGTEDGEISIWNLTTKKSYLKEKLGSPILSILFHDSKIITQEKDGPIKLFQLEEQVLNLICSKAVTNSGFCRSIIIEHLLVVPGEASIDLYNIESMTITQSLIHDKDKKFGMLMCLIKVETSCGLFLLAIYETGDGVLWDINSFSVAGTIKFQPQPISATFDKKKERGIVVGQGNKIQIFEVRCPDSGDLNILYQLEVPSGTLTAVKIRPDGLVFVVGGGDGKLRYFSWKSLKLLVVLTEHVGAITDIQFVPNKIDECSKTTMVASSSDGAISFWDIY